MDPDRTTDAGESHPSSRRIQRLSAHLSPADSGLPSVPPQLRRLTCARVKLEVDSEKLSLYMRGKHRELQEKVYEFFNLRPDLQTPLEISKDGHRELCMRQLLGLVRETGIRPFRHVFEDPSKYFAILEAVGSVDISLGIKMGVQYSLWGGSVINLGTKRHRDKYFNGIDSIEYPGCFAMTELHHGSNVQALQTVAKFDPITDEFIVNTPNDGAIKWWIGNAAVHGKFATVFARLILPTHDARGTSDMGVHAFIVPIRDMKTHQTLPGIEIHDCGYKVGLNGVDNGALRFSSVRIPRENLLNRFGDVSRDGKYTSSLPSINKRFAATLGELVGGRVGLAYSSVGVLKIAITIAIGRHIAKTFPRSCNDAMAPGKKSKRSGKKKDPKKLKKRRSIAVAPVDPRAVDTEWWDIFWRKNSSASGSVPDNEEEGFKYFFRLSKQTFAYICSLVREDLISCPPSGLINIEGRLLSVEKQVAIALRRLASGDSQVSVGAAFGVGQSTVSQVTWRFIEALEDRGRHHLKWPDSDSAEVIKSRFEELYGLPNCCGAMDATHIIMTLPAVQTSDDWCDPANNYSMFLQGVVDHELRFLDIVTGWPGGMTVPKLLKFSGLFKLCESGARLNGPVERTSEGVPEIAREYVVGGAAYPLLPWLITPYESTELSCSAASNFNAVHESARSLAVMAFLQLKGSWRILSKVMWRPDKQKLPSIILVCCLLHNIIVDTGDKLNPDVALSGHHDSGYVEQCCKQVDPLGKTVRDNLAKYLKCVKERA